MKTIDDIFLSEITNGKVYWNSSRPIEQELMYFLLIDRFHDGKARQTISSSIGFGTEEQLQVRCGGNIKGVTNQLEYISEMGFTSIWLNPFLQNNPESYHGYAIENFLEVDSQWGTKEDIVKLVEKGHALGMRIFFDVVLNHTGDNWSYRKQDPIYSKGVQYATKTWRYTDKPIPAELRNFNCYNRKGRIRRWEERPQTWDGDIFELKDLVQDESAEGNQNLKIMIAIYSYWISLTDCDGFRIDAAKHIPPKWLNDFIIAMKSFTKSSLKKDFFVFVEVIANETIVKQYSNIDGYLDFDFYFSTVGKLLKRKKGVVDFMGKHLNVLPIRFLDNHDQIGQMPKQRIGRGLPEQQLINLLRVFLLLPGLPCIYYGTEQGLIGHGRNDGSIRECLFDIIGNDDILNRESLFYKTIQEFSAIRQKFGMFQGIVESCLITKSLTNNCIALQITNLGVSKLILYNLGAQNELVCIKLTRPISRTNKLVVYLYSDTTQNGVKSYIKDNLVCDIALSSFGFRILDLGNV